AQRLPAIKGTAYSDQFDAIVKAEPQGNWYQSYEWLKNLAEQLAQRIQQDLSPEITQVQQFVAPFSADQGEQVNKLLADAKGLDQTKIKTDLKALHGKITAEMQKLIDANQAGGTAQAGATRNTTATAPTSANSGLPQMAPPALAIESMPNIQLL